jgi:hypothetical protein
MYFLNFFVRLRRFPMIGFQITVCKMFHVQIVTLKFPQRWKPNDKDLEYPKDLQNQVPWDHYTSWQQRRLRNPSPLIIPLSKIFFPCVFAQPYAHISAFEPGILHILNIAWWHKWCIKTLNELVTSQLILNMLWQSNDP